MFKGNLVKACRYPENIKVQLAKIASSLFFIKSCR